MAMTLQPFFPLLLPTKIAITAARAAIIAKAKTIGLSDVELPVEPPGELPVEPPVKLPVSPLKPVTSPLIPATSLFPKSVKKPGELLDPPEPTWSPNAK